MIPNKLSGPLLSVAEYDAFANAATGAMWRAALSAMAAARAGCYALDYYVRIIASGLWGIKSMEILGVQEDVHAFTVEQKDTIDGAQDGEALARAVNACKCDKLFAAGFGAEMLATGRLRASANKYARPTP